MKLIYLLLVAHFTVAQMSGETNKSDKNSNDQKEIINTTTALSTVAVTSTSSLEEETLDINVTTEFLLVTTCEANSSCPVSIVKPTINSTLAEENVTNIPTGPELHDPNLISSVRDICTCNLQLNICDINCCCDQDCSADDKFIFHHCESENFYYDTRYCDYMKYIYINNTPFQWHINQNGLFCVLRSNLPPIHTIQRKMPLSSYEVAEQSKYNKFSWPSNFEKKEVKYNTSEHFVYGNNVWIIYGNKIKKFQVPKKYFSNRCLMKEDVLNLKNIKNTCAQTDVSEENKYLHFRNYFQNVTVVANPKLLNFSKYKNIQGCPKNICLSILPKICNDNFNICHNILLNDTRLDFKCDFDIKNSKNYCRNAVKALLYNFYHNGTKGYIKVELMVILEDVSYQFGVQDLEFHQEVNVNFFWINQTRNFSAMLSGSPGYQIGKPILSGNLVNVGNATNAVFKIRRPSVAFAGAFLVLPENVMGNCVLNSTKYLPIEFGYNLLTKCKFNTTAYNENKYYNGTEICRRIQKTILKLWGVTNSDQTVGMFGNANANIPDDWIKIMYNVVPEKLLNQTSGKFNWGNTTLTCFGLVRKVIVGVYHSRIDFKMVLNQEKILGVTYTFDGFLNKTLPFNKHTNSTYLELDLESQVLFYDISVEKKKKLVDAPSLEIKLPYDFFYPFIKIDNGVGIWSAHISLNMVLCLVIFLVK